MIALILGTALALAALGFVLWPLFAQSGDVPLRRSGLGDAPVLAPEQDPVDVLREIEFDRATGKLSDDDYAVLKAQYTERALAMLRAGESADAAQALAPEEAAEAAILRHRAQLADCGHCGPRPEPDAIYCSDCGRYLAGRCPSCGTTTDEPGARYCGGCGHQLAA